MSSCNDDEKLILSYFFTNLDKPIFLAKNFHPEVWALMQARYSRSSIGMREGFLELLKEDGENFAQLVQYLRESKGGASMDHAVAKAMQFMDKWVLGYGHSSVAEGAVVGVGLEGVSILATKVIEDNRLASYIEKSTRYVSFDRNSFLIPQEIKESSLAKDAEKLINLQFQTYQDFHEPVLSRIKELSPVQAGQNENAWLRSCAARRFDSVRYLLPACTKTSLGWTLNARTLAHAISKLLSHPLAEMRQIGEALREEGKKCLPSLLKYAERNEYFVSTEQDGAEFVNSLLGAVKAKKGEAVALAFADRDGEEKVLAAILYKHSTLSLKEARGRVKKMSGAQKEALIESVLKTRGQFDALAREFEHCAIGFDVLMDYGAFRDLQRHRLCTQSNQLLTPNFGYDVPEDIVACGEALVAKYKKVMKKSAQLYGELAKTNIHAAQYVLPLAYKKRVLMDMNLRQAFYLIKLRSTPQGHISYRCIAKGMYDLVCKQYPLFAKYFVCDLSNDELGRLKQETKFEEKLAR
ncbi:MAG: FAD-dependent thymidylate synthase [Deltaproteobacteria bacterium]|nr:FAD-dependent thymidylate synthase [Deltaproteobacteria bacterium]